MNRVMCLALSMFFLVCGCGDVNGVGSEPKPKLHIVERDGGKYLYDDNGNLWYSLSYPPHIDVDVDRKVFVISPETTAYYAPGAPYMGKSYDGFNVVCQYSRYKGTTFDFGPDAGEIDIPKSPHYNCGFKAFIIDGDGAKFETDTQLIYFKRTL